MSVAEFHERFLALEGVARAVVSTAEAEPEDSTVTVALAVTIGQLATELRKLDDLRARIDAEDAA